MLGVDAYMTIEDNVVKEDCVNEEKKNHVIQDPEIGSEIESEEESPILRPKMRKRVLKAQTKALIHKQKTNEESEQTASVALSNNSKSKLIQKSGKNRKWTEDEKKRFIEGIQLYGKDWVKVAKFVGSRNNEQVNKYSQNLRKNLK